MCGIIGYRGKKNGSEIVIQGLKALEYRGYDSWGIAAKNNGSLHIHKEVGKVSDFNKMDSLPKSGIAIGHTRWSTHGAVTWKNAHPHTCCTQKIAVVHNGIIENYEELLNTVPNHEIASETDTEVVAHMIGDLISSGKSFEEAFTCAISKLKGRFAIVAVSSEENMLMAARRGSPLVLGVGDAPGETFLASDTSAFTGLTTKAIYLEDGDVVSVSDTTTIRGASGNVVQRPVEDISAFVDTASLDGHPHYMIKEILEQKHTIRSAVDQPPANVQGAAAMIDSADDVYIIGCGTAGKVALTGNYLFARIAKKRVTALIASEFDNYYDFVNDKSVIISISQSGETADSLEVLDNARKQGAKIISIVNVVNSTMDRISDLTLYCNAGAEKAVCSTKVTTSQIAILTLLAYACARKYEEGVELLSDVASHIGVMLSESFTNNIIELSKIIAKKESLYIIGRGINFPVAKESAIKLQEVPYIHAEGFAGGELKHGPIALIEKGTVCIVLTSSDSIERDTIVNAMEIRSRGGFIVGVGPKKHASFDFWIPVPDVGVASCIVNLIPIQLLSYYSALEKGIEPDKPRNLAKSVTVK